MSALPPPLETAVIDLLNSFAEGFLDGPGGCAGHRTLPCNRNADDVDIPGTDFGTRIVLDRHVTASDVDLSRRCISGVRAQGTVLIGRSFDPEAIAAANAEPVVVLIRHDGTSITGGVNRAGSDMLRKADLP